MKFSDNEKGFTLLETLIAMVIFVIGILVMWSMQVTSIKGNRKANDITLASTWCAKEIEKIMLKGYMDIEDGPDKDGTNQPMNDNGEDTDGGNFGLDDDTIATADYNITSPDGIYTILWNVAEEVPLPHTKTVKVIVLGGVQHKIEYEYIKTDII